MEEERKVLSITQLADMCNLTRQAIYIAIRKGGLKAIKVEGCWRIFLADYKDYLGTKYSREKSRDSLGKLLHSPAEGRYSLKQAAQVLNIKYNTLYYRIAIKLIRYTKVDGRMLILQDEINRLLKSE